MDRVYGWRPDEPDSRDYILKVDPSVELPKRIDLRAKMSPVEDQGQIGSCTAQAFAGCLEYFDRRDDMEYTDVSRLYIYFNERIFIWSMYQDSGAYIRDGIKALKVFGAADEKVWPYDVSKVFEWPPVTAYMDGIKRRVKDYYRTNGVGGIKYALAQGWPVVFGFTVFSSYEGEESATTGIVPMPRAWEPERGGHAELMVGYDDEATHNGMRGYFLSRNSWGKHFGDKGYSWFPYAFIDKYASDFWVIRTYRR